MTTVLNLLLMAFVVTNMFAMGTALGLKRMLAPMRDVGLMARALLANIVLAPLIVYVMHALAWIDRETAIALLLLATAAGSPTTPKLAEIAKGNLGVAVSVTLFLMAVSLFSMPLTVPLLIPGATVDTFPIARSLIVFTLLPLLAGIALQVVSNVTAARLAPAFSKTATFLMVIAMILAPIVHWDKISGFLFGGAFLMGMLFSASTLLVGWLAGGFDDESRKMLCLGTAQRNIAAAVVVGTQNFSEPAIVTTLILVTVASWFLIVPLARYFGYTADLRLAALAGKHPI